MRKYIIISDEALDPKTSEKIQANLRKFLESDEPVALLCGSSISNIIVLEDDSVEQTAFGLVKTKNNTK